MILFSKDKEAQVELMERLIQLKYRTIVEDNLLEAEKNLRLKWRLTFLQKNNSEYATWGKIKWLNSKQIYVWEVQT